MFRGPVLMTLRQSLSLLTMRDRRLLAVVTVVQMSTALMDLAGVVLIGVITGIALARVSGSETPAIVTRVQSLLGLDGMSEPGFIAVLAGSAAILLIGKSLLSIFLTRRTLRFLANRQAAISGRLVDELLSRPLVFVQKRATQETAYALLNGVSAAMLFALGQGVVALTEAALLATMAVGLFIVNPTLTLGAMVYFAIVAMALHFAVSGWASRLGRRVGNAEIDSIKTIQEAIHAYREITVADLRSDYARRFQALRWQAASVNSDLQFIGLAPKYVFEIALVIGAGVLALSQIGSVDAIAALSTVAVFLAAGTRIVPSLMRLQGAGASVRMASGQAAPTLELARELGIIDSPADARSPFHGATERALYVSQSREDFVPSVKVSHVSLTYPGASQPALNDVSLEIPVGATIALVGSTGSGKSTLVDTILGVLVPDSGSVAISHLPPMGAIRSWPGAISYVPQRVHLFDDTIRENVAIGRMRSNASDDQIIRALDMAQLTDLINESPDGLDTLIGENGLKLSGGQRQRLGIARALFTDPQLLVLDEATSALDTVTELGVVESLHGLGAEVTVIVIAHRLSTIKAADCVYYLDEGRIVASGTFEELRAQNPDFEAQARLSGL